MLITRTNWAQDVDMLHITLYLICNLFLFVSEANNISSWLKYLGANILDHYVFVGVSGGGIWPNYVMQNLRRRKSNFNIKHLLCIATSKQGLCKPFAWILCTPHHIKWHSHAYAIAWAWSFFLDSGLVQVSARFLSHSTVLSSIMRLGGFLLPLGWSVSQCMQTMHP